MTIEEFNIEKGLYIFEFSDFETEFHSHPPIEIIIAENGEFTLWTNNGKHTNLKIAIIAANQKHKLSSPNYSLKIIMIEHHSRFVIEHLANANIDLINGYYLQTKYDNEKNHIGKLVQLIKIGKTVSEYDFRISETIDFLDKNDLDYSLMMKTLKAITNLSESRLSHLFKSNIGISLKKYLIWTKLKSTIKQYLNSKDDLFSSLIKCGFYDQPHFSNSFKSMLGIKPSKAYNSRILQVLPIST